MSCELVCRIQNLHISQTDISYGSTPFEFVEFKIYISLKLMTELRRTVTVCRIQNLHISQTK